MVIGTGAQGKIGKGTQHFFGKEGKGTRKRKGKGHSIFSGEEGKRGKGTQREGKGRSLFWVDSCKLVLDFLF